MEPIETPQTTLVEWFWAAPDEALFSQKDLVAVTGLSAGFFERSRWSGGGPRFLKLGGGHLVRYRKADVVDWINQRPPAASTSETLPQPVGSPRGPGKRRARGDVKQKARAKAKSARRTTASGKNTAAQVPG